MNGVGRIATKPIEFLGRVECRGSPTRRGLEWRNKRLKLRVSFPKQRSGP
jgi:hypothetical protein